VLSKAIVDACDKLDGIQDGVIEDPRACKFDPATLICKQDQDPNTCFTAKQVQAVKTIWNGARNSTDSSFIPAMSRARNLFPARGELRDRQRPGKDVTSRSRTASCAITLPGSEVRFPQIQLRPRFSGSG